MKKSGRDMNDKKGHGAAWRRLFAVAVIALLCAGETPGAAGTPVRVPGETSRPGVRDLPDIRGEARRQGSKKTAGKKAGKRLRERKATVKEMNARRARKAGAGKAKLKNARWMDKKTKSARRLKLAAHKSDTKKNQPVKGGKKR